MSAQSRIDALYVRIDNLELQLAAIAQALDLVHPTTIKARRIDAEYHYYLEPTGLYSVAGPNKTSKYVTSPVPVSKVLSALLHEFGYTVVARDPRCGTSATPIIELIDSGDK